MQSVLVSFGLSGTVANTVAGVIFTYTQAYHIGDRVQISDTIGDIVVKALFVTWFRTINNGVITIPNTTVLSKHVINLSDAESDDETPPLILPTTIKLGYDVLWRQVNDMLIQSLLAKQGILHDPAHFMLPNCLEDFYVSYALNPHTKESGKMACNYSGLHQTIQANFMTKNIKILSPHYRAVRNGSATAIPRTHSIRS